MTSFDNGGGCPEPSRPAHHFHCINPEVCGIMEVISLGGREKERIILFEVESASQTMVSFKGMERNRRTYSGEKEIYDTSGGQIFLAIP